MTDTTTTPDDTQPTADTTEPGEPENPPEDETDSGAEGSGREAKLRKRAQAAEAERDELRERLEAMQRAEVERIAESAGIQAAALWAAGELSELLDDAGNIDPERVAAALDDVRERFGLPGKGGQPVPGVGDRPSGITRTAAQQFSDAFSPKRR